MTSRIYCAGSPNNRRVMRCRLTHYMKQLTYLLASFSAGYTAQCLAGLAGLMPGPFFILGFAAAVFCLSQAYK